MTRRALCITLILWQTAVASAVTLRHAHAHACPDHSHGLALWNSPPASAPEDDDEGEHGHLLILGFELFLPADAAQPLPDGVHAASPDTPDDAPDLGLVGAVLPALESHFAPRPVAEFVRPPRPSVSPDRSPILRA